MEPGIAPAEVLIVLCILGIFLAVGAAIVVWWRDHSRVRQAGEPGALQWQREGYRITTDRKAMDVDAIHAFLSRSYWSPGISRELVARAMQHSLCFGLFDHDRQIGFARYATDHTRFAYLMDVYVLEEYRGQGLGQWLIACTLEHPDIARCRRLLLTTRDGHELYRRFGFVELPNPDRWMERFIDPSER